MGRLQVEVVYAQSGAEDLVTLSLAPGSRAIDALRLSGLPERHPEIDRHDPLLGIFGTRVAPESVLADGDRLEIYRPLRADPKELRRHRASTSRQTKR